MSIKSVPNGYMVDVRPQGRNGKRYRKTFKTKAEALQYERWVISTKNTIEWLEKPRDARQLSILIDLWYQHHGQYLKSGAADLNRLKRIDRYLHYLRVYQFTKSHWLDYRNVLTSENVSPSTINRDQMLLSSVFTVLIKAGDFYQDHPLKGLAKMKVRAKNMTFLSLDEIHMLLNNLSGDALKIAKVCLDTGARWSEASKLKGSQLVNCKIIFVDTKNGKNRTIPITSDLFKELYTGKNGTLFNASYHHFREVIKGLDFDLPKGQAAHVLRHTYASHFMINGGNILTLQQILGHSTIIQTMAYAHLAPDHLQDAITFRPLTTI
ncbi:tyrosine-type recombinase/integrase [Shewanella sp. D64]|uniref:phage integrase n=1 Tax=unclassified Shewanella TaxID=196818 RepID=UPI0022BA60F8|nr:MULTISPECIES: tyrosine-type recombinase/integrase [unclassified Shewanella]MEC4729125.1 tyrosine-type recombinase/integrase [Shewanella sp. D64]MEC4740905.1 tyrosine-type recombinase/integrase [Shewanella sp. E94]WBJ95730.1 tyrosine-type recombinase/integrase [Shewanella sp. MTB7]